MEKYEDKLKSALLAEIKVQIPRLIVQRHEDVRKAGVPDFSTDGAGKCRWWEVKHATPDFHGKEYQELNCLRLAVANFCRYIVYQEDKQGKRRVMIIHPEKVLRRNGKMNAIDFECYASGFDHAWVTRYIRDMHRLGE